MKSTEQIKDLRTKNVDDLKNILSSTEQELMNLRFRLASGQLKQTAQIRTIKRKIAQTKTLLSEKALEQLEQ